MKKQKKKEKKMNKVHLLGRIAQDLELKKSGENSILNFSVAIARDYKNQNGEKDTDFINCSVFGKRAETIAQYFKKGEPIVVFGSIRVDKKEIDGKVNIYTSVFVEGFSFVPSSNKVGNALDTAFSNMNKPQKNNFELTDDDLPF